MKAKFKKGDVVYYEMDSVIPFGFDLLVVVETFLSDYSKDPFCLLQWGEPDKKTGLPRLITCWEHLLVKIGEL